jgi:hypothetical protein
MSPASEWTGALVYFEPGRAGNPAITLYCSDLRHRAAGTYYAYGAVGVLTVMCAGARIRVPLCADCALTQVPDES